MSEDIVVGSIVSIRDDSVRDSRGTYLPEGRYKVIQLFPGGASLQNKDGEESMIGTALELAPVTLSFVLLDEKKE